MNKIRTTVKELLSSFDALVEVGQTKMPAVLAYRFGKISEGIEKELKAYAKARDNTIQSWGTLQDTGGYKIPDEYKPDYERELTELLNEPVEIDRHKLRYEDFKDVQITPASLMAIHYLFEEEAQ